MAGQNNVKRMKELINILNKADEEYFGDDNPTMADREYDILFNELCELEKTTGIVFANSPTNKTSGTVKNGLEKVKHTKPMLSAKKTKNPEDVITFASASDTLLSWKLDGLTLVLRYNEGTFQQAITRGDNGIIGEDVTLTVSYMRNIPMNVECPEPFEVRGEGVMPWADFKAISMGSDRGHPRNTAAGAVRAKEADVDVLSHIDFIAFELIKANDVRKTKEEQLDFLISQGFQVIEYKELSATLSRDKMLAKINSFNPESYLYPVDGIIAEYNDIAFGRSLGATSHHENRMLALKWADNLYETTFRGVTLTTTRTGMVAIIAEFDPVLIEGGHVKRADLHSLGNFEKFKFGIGDRITVYKANMIIPQVAENLTQSGTFMLPNRCSCCGRRLEVKKSASGVRNLFCPNIDCIARNAQKLARFCEKDGMNIEALNAAKIEDLMAYDILHSYADIFNLKDKRERILNIPGFGHSTFDKIIGNIEKCRDTSLGRLLYGMGIDSLGTKPAGALNDYFCGSWGKFEEAIDDEFCFSEIDGVSDSLNKKIYSWYKEVGATEAFRDLLEELNFPDSKRKSKNAVATVIKEAAGTGGVPQSDEVTATNCFTERNVAFTGTVNGMLPDTMADVLRLIGANPSKEIKKDTDVLVVGKTPNPAMISKAILQGVKILTGEEFARMLAL